MGGLGKSKTIELLLKVFPDNFLASSITYRQGADSPQGNSVPRKNSRFVPVDNLVDGDTGSDCGGDNGGDNSTVAQQSNA
jgi:hypothetical protein